MAWLDDRAWCHPKIIGLTDKQFRVYVNGLAYASGMGTRGFLSTAQQKLLGGTPAIRTALIAANVWDEQADGGVYIHSWDEHNAKRDERREKDRERKRNARNARQSVTCPQERPQDIPQDSPGGTSAGTARVETVEGSDKELQREADASLRAVTVAPKAKQRERDFVWDGLDSLYGKITNDGERGRRNKAAQLIRQSLAANNVAPVDYEHEMRWRKDALEASWGKPCTAHALATNWQQAERVAAFQPPPDPHQRRKPTVSERIAETNAKLMADTEFSQRFGLFSGGMTRTPPDQPAPPQATLELAPGDILEEAS